MRRLLLALAPALALSCSGATGKSTPPAPTPAAATSETPVGGSDDGGAGFAAPPAEEQPRGGSPTAEASPELAEKIKRTFGDNCRYERACNELIGVDCNAAVDGPYYYVRRDSLAVVSTCGGACMRGCTDCPPPGWTCEVY